MDPPVEILPLLYPSMPLTRVLTALLSLSERLVNWACAATLSVSSGVDELLRGRGWQKPILRFYNIHGTLAAAELPDPAVRSESGWDDATIVVYAGALQPGIRGIEEQLRAIARIPPEYNVRMLLVGHGPGDVFHPLIKSLGIEERVRFLGSVDPKRLSAILSACDTAVFKSLSYALPSKVFEYVAHGLRIVSMEGATDVNVVLGRFVTTYDGTDEGLARALASPSSSRGYTIEDARQHLAALREESRTSLVTAVDIASRASHSR
jgi:glycosyltransferase involved in cell wall biosynthesis